MEHQACETISSSHHSPYRLEFVQPCLSNDNVFSCWASAFLYLSLSSVSAWLPAEHKDIIARDGTDLFKSTSSTKSRSLSGSSKVRGVNIGSLFVFEPSLAGDEWSSMGCAGMQSEFDCVSRLGQSKANTVFQTHWNSWITKTDLLKMKSYGLNTIRVPVGYWMKEGVVVSWLKSLSSQASFFPLVIHPKEIKLTPNSSVNIVYSSEHFPQGAIGHLRRLCGMASDLGMYIIIDLHGAPGAQVPKNSDTGQYAPSAGFYVDHQYARAVAFLSWITNQIHTHNEFRNVGMLGIVNEPLQNAPLSLLTDYYPTAYKAIRSAESSLGISHTESLHVQIMNPHWSSNNPKQNLGDAFFISYDDHRYIKWDSAVSVSQFAYIINACHSFRGSTDGIPTIVGEFSLSVADEVEHTSPWDPATQQSFYKSWFAAMTATWESQTNGWIFWTWKAQLGDARWSYRDAVMADLIPSGLGNLNSGICSKY